MAARAENIRIVPYVSVDGIMTFPDSAIMRLYDRMVEDGTVKVVFYSGHIQNRAAFLKYMKRRGVLLYVLMCEAKPAGFTWLDRIEDKSAHNHFCLFSDHWGNASDIGSHVISTLMSMENKNGYLFDVFKGEVPTWNTRAIDFAINSGGKKLGVMPKAVWNADKNESEDAAIIYYTREAS